MAKRKPKTETELPKRGRGRPSIYTEALGAEICRRIAGGEMLPDICAEERMPHRDTVHQWRSDDAHKGFSDAYARAQESRGVGMLDEIITMARRCVPADGSAAVDHNAARTYIEAHKWTAMKLAPRHLGDRVELTGAGGGPIQTEEKKTSAVDRLLEAALARLTATERTGGTPADSDK